MLLINNKFISLTIFLMGPCHKIYMDGCGLSSLKEYETPLGNININTESI